MNITIIGAGNVGGTLGTRWAKSGHKVIFGVRNPGDPKIKQLLENGGPNTRATDVAEAVQGSDVIVLATPWEAARNAIQSAGSLAGKILVDATNPLTMGAKGLELSLGYTTSAAEQVAAWAKGARVVKAFNTTGQPNMADPKYGSQNATMFICGDDLQSKATVKTLSEELGFETFDAGTLATARLLEPLAMLWVHLALSQGLGTDFCFKVLKR